MTHAANKARLALLRAALANYDPRFDRRAQIKPLSESMGTARDLMEFRVESLAEHIAGKASAPPALNYGDNIALNEYLTSAGY